MSLAGRTFLLSILTVMLVACGGGGSGSSSPDVLQGSFVDAPVAGLNYRTSTQQGVTGTQGQFQYLKGETVLFSLGGVTLGESMGNTSVTPSDLTGYGLASEDTKTRNILRLLQTLDEDCDPSNGISIGSAVQVRLADLEMEIPDTVLGFEQNAELRALLDESACADEWVTALQAESHYRLSMQQQAADGLAEIALIVLDGETVPTAAVDAQGNSITLLAGDETTGAFGRIVLTGSSGEQVGVSLDADGMPSTLYLGNGVIIRMANYTRESVDVLISAPDGSLIASHTIPLTDELRGYFDYFNALTWTDGPVTLTHAPVKEPGAGMALLDALITPAYAEDLTQNLSEKMKRAVGVVNYATGVVKEAVEIDAVLKGEKSAAGYVGDYLKDAAGKIKEGATSALKDVLWNAAMNGLGLNQDEQRVLDVSIAALQCAAAANVAGCKDAFVESISATYELGGLLYDYYQDADRLAKIEAQLELIDFDSRPPAVSLDTSIDGSSYSVGAEINLRGEAYDPDEGFIPNERLFWKSNIDGALGTGESLTISTLTPGVHVITFTAEASDGERRSMRLSVEIGNTAPVVTINGPQTGSNYADGDYIVFSGTANDAEEGTLSGTQLEWRTSFDNRLLGTGTVLVTNDLEAPQMGTYSAAYTHIVTLTATDSYGASSSESVEVNIHNILLLPPTVAITSTETTYTLGQSAVIAATALSAEGLAITTNSIQWSSSLDGVVGYGAELDAALLSEGTHTLTVTATDNGLSVSDSIEITVTPLATGTIEVSFDSAPLWTPVEWFNGYTYAYYEVGSTADLSVTLTNASDPQQLYFSWCVTYRQALYKDCSGYQMGLTSYSIPMTELHFPVASVEVIVSTGPQFDSATSTWKYIRLNLVPQRPAGTVIYYDDATGKEEYYHNTDVENYYFGLYGHYWHKVWYGNGNLKSFEATLPSGMSYVDDIIRMECTESGTHIYTYWSDEANGMVEEVMPCPVH